MPEQLGFAHGLVRYMLNQAVLSEKKKAEINKFDVKEVVGHSMLRVIGFEMPKELGKVSDIGSLSLYFRYSPKLKEKELLSLHLWKGLLLLSPPFQQSLDISQAVFYSPQAFPSLSFLKPFS